MNSSSEISPASRLSQVRLAAMNYLALREHSQLELRNRLRQKCESEEVITQALQQLAKEGLQSDERFADVFVRMRYRQGKGPRHIAMELSERGVATEYKSAALAEHDWFALCREVRERRFGLSATESPKEKARQLRFLQYRGFTSDQIRYAMKAEISEE